MTAEPTPPDVAARWPLLRGFAGFRPADIPADLLAGLTLAAIAVPEQMATARLAGLPPRLGFYAFIAGAIAFALFGSSRRLSIGADSTIAPIFAGALTLMAASGSAHFDTLAACLALLVGVVVCGAGLMRLGWIGDLLSIPVTTGFLAGIAVHIVASQAPEALGLAPPAGDLPRRLLTLAGQLGQARPIAMAIAGGVLATIVLAHRLSRRLPAALIAVGGACVAASALHLDRAGLALLGAVDGGWPSIGWPTQLDLGDLAPATPLALLVALIVMAQTAATARAFAQGPAPPDINGDFVGVGAASFLSGLMGAFPVNASPPRTGVIAESGGRSPLAGLIAAGLIGLLLAFAADWLRSVPQAALAGVLLFVAARLVRVREIVDIARASPLEAALVAATAMAIIVLPIASGVAVGVLLSLVHGAWSAARVPIVALGRIPGSTVWWPPAVGRKLESEPGVAVLGFAAPLTFLNAAAFARGFLVLARKREAKLVILEAAGLVALDYTGAGALRSVVEACRAQDQVFAVARLESVAAQAAFRNFGLAALIGEDHMFESVADAIETLGGGGGAQAVEPR